jgi:hypothetical protein
MNRNSIEAIPFLDFEPIHPQPLVRQIPVAEVIVRDDEGIAINSLRRRSGVQAMFVMAFFFVGNFVVPATVSENVLPIHFCTLRHVVSPLGGGNSYLYRKVTASHTVPC